MLALLGPWPLCIVAQDTITTKTHHLKEVTVTESMADRAVRSTTPMHVLGAMQFEAYGVTDFADALNRLPGINLRDYGGAGGMKTVSVRGFGAQHTGVSYDGIMLGDAQSGQIDLARYSLDNVESVSLVVGDNDDIFIPAKNASTAVVLNISNVPVPSASSKPNLTAQIRFGSFGYVCPFFRYCQSLGEKLAFSLVGEYTYADNDYPFLLRNVTITTKERRTNSSMNSGHSELNVVWQPGKRDRLSAKLYYYDNDRQLPGQVRYYTSLSGESLRDRNLFGQLSYQSALSQSFSVRANAKYNWASSKYRDRMYKDGVNDADYWQREVYLSACLLYEPVASLAFDYSVDYSFNNLTSSLKTDTKPFRNSILQSLTAKYTSRNLTMVARILGSLYYNDAKTGESSRDMRKLSPSLSLSYKPFDRYDIYLRASYKNIFRVPTFNESYFFHYGSPTLNPEKTDQFNIGVTLQGKAWKHSDAQFSVDGYLNHVKDKIVAVPYNMFVWTNINVGKVRMLGIDATANVTHHFSQKHSLVFSGSYSYQSVQNRTSRTSPYYGYQIAYVPLHSGSASIGYDNPWVNIVLHGTGTSMKYGTNEHLDETDIDGYWDMGLTLSRRFSIGKNHFNIRADIKNLLNRQYEIVRKYPMPRRSWQVTIKYQL